MKFYVATSLQNASNARRFRDLMFKLGHEITFDWMEAPSMHANDPRGGEDSDFEAKSQRAMDDMNGVLDADAVIVMLPGGLGTHVELGVAAGAALLVSRTGENNESLKWYVDQIDVPRIFLWAPGGLEEFCQPGGYSCVFWYMNEGLVTGDMSDLIAEVEAWWKSKSTNQ